MQYKEFTVTTTSEAEDLVAEIFWRYTDFGVAVCSIADVIELIDDRRDTFDYIDENVLIGDADVSFVKGYFELNESDVAAKALRADLETLRANSQGYFDLGTLEVVTRTVNGDDWIDVWRKHFKPIEFDKIVVCPEWIKCQTDKPIVLIGSNNAFGTGEHETTSMCIEYLEKYLRSSDVVIDVGTGSGILGISCAKLGADKVYMTDNDQVAVDSAKRNVLINKVENICFPTLADLFGQMNVKGDVVVANITAEILSLLSRDVTSYLKRGGVLIMSGILNAKLKSVISVYTALGFETLEYRTIGEWSAVTMRLK